MSEKIPGAKEDKGKLQMSIVPPEIITAIAEVRRYGLTKYAEPANWQRLDPQILHEALLRHCVALWTDWTATLRAACRTCGIWRRMRLSCAGS